MDITGRAPTVMLAVLLVLTLGSAPPRASRPGQVSGDSTGSIVVVTKDFHTGTALDGVVVVVLGAGCGTVTDKSGMGSIVGLKPGPAQIRSVRHRYERHTDSLLVRRGARDTLTLRLEEAELQFIVETNSESPPSSKKSHAKRRTTAGNPPSVEQVAVISVQGHGASLLISDPLGRTWDWDGKHVVNRLPDCVYAAVTVTPGPGGPQAGDEGRGIPGTDVTIRKLIPGEYIIRVTARERIEPFVHVQMWENDKVSGVAADIVSLPRGAMATWAATWHCFGGSDTCWAGLRRIHGP